MLQLTKFGRRETLAMFVTRDGRRAFFIASAAFRSFRAHDFRAALLLASGVVVMIGRVPLGASISPIFPNLAGWLMAYPNAAGQRALYIGAALGVLATGLRVISGIERPYLRGE